MNKLTKRIGIGLLSLASLVGCSDKRSIEVVARADFDGDGIEDVIGYYPYSFFNLQYDLIVVNGKGVKKQGDNFYILDNFPGRKYKIVQPKAKMFNQERIGNVSVEDVNEDGLPDLSYDMTIGTRKHKVFYNQGDGTLKGEI